jgi:hypothetical protein
MNKSRLPVKCQQKENLSSKLIKAWPDAIENRYSSILNFDLKWNQEPP